MMVDWWADWKATWLGRWKVDLLVRLWDDSLVGGTADYLVGLSAVAMGQQSADKTVADSKVAASVEWLAG